LSTAAQQRANDLCSDPAADYAGKRIADDSEVILLQCDTGHVAAHSARDQLNNQTDYSAPHSEPPSTYDQECRRDQDRSSCDTPPIVSDVLTSYGRCSIG